MGDPIPSRIFTVLKLKNMKMTTREKMMELLETKWDMSFISTTEDFRGSQGGIWLSAENGESARDGFRLFDYWSENHTKYNIGVHTEISKWAEKHGWWFEWNDPGTIMLWPND